MFRNKRRQEEEEAQQAQQEKKTPEDMLAREAKLAEKLLEDLVPEEPSVQNEKEEATAVVDSPEKPAGTEEAKQEVKAEGAEQAQAQGDAAVPSEDQLSIVVEKIGSLGGELVGLRDEIKKARDNYTTKAKEMEDLQAKLKEAMGQFS